jgi:thiol-disulfide isomerase/thioredoxin
VLARFAPIRVFQADGRVASPERARGVPRAQGQAMGREPQAHGEEMSMAVDRIGETLTDQNFQTMVLESPQPVLVAFWAEGCGPWYMLAPAIAALAEAFQGSGSQTIRSVY